jgi:hypothetical protein
MLIPAVEFKDGGTLEFNKNETDDKLTYTGNTTVKGGILKIVGGLGAVYNGDKTAVTDYNYAGKIEFTKEGGATVSGIEFSGKSGGVGQKLSGLISGAPGTKISVTKGQILEIASDTDNAPHPHPYKNYIAANHPHNTHQGDLYIGADGSTLTISGRLNVDIENFDSGTPWGISYQHSRYSGNMEIAGGGTLNFAYKGDYQLHSGNLTGAGNLNINTGRPFYNSA